MQQRWVTRWGATCRSLTRAGCVAVTGSLAAAGFGATILLSAPAGLAPDIAGPRVYGIPELLSGYLHARGLRRPMVPIRLPGKAARAVRAGANLAPEGTLGHRTWEDFLAERVSQPA